MGKLLSNGSYADQVYATDVLAPVGAHSANAVIATATVLTKPAGATAIRIQTIGQAVRYTLDGTTPTATVGFQLAAAAAPVVIPVPGASITIIQEAATAALQYQWMG